MVDIKDSSRHPTVHNGYADSSMLGSAHWQVTVYRFDSRFSWAKSVQFSFKAGPAAIYAEPWRVRTSRKQFKVNCRNPVIQAEKTCFPEDLILELVNYFLTSV